MKDKIAFVVAFLGVFIAITPFKGTLINIKLDYIFFRTDLYEILYIPLIFLFITVYVYAIDHTKYGFKVFDSWSIFKYFEVIGNTFYLLAIFSPVLIFATYFLIQIISLIPFKNIPLEIISYITNILAVIATLIFSIRATIRQRRYQSAAKEEDLENSSINAELEAKKMFEQKNWNLTILESFRSLELAINKKLIDFGIDAKRLPMLRTLDLLIKNGILNREDFQKINYFRSLRNEAEHSNINFTQDDVEKVVSISKEIIQKLEKKYSSNGITTSPKILLVEDYKHSQIIVTRLLAKHNFNNIFVVENGQEAIDVVKNQKYDLILMDMQMPVMNGFEATERIRQMPEYTDTPIIALTAFAMKGDREKCLEAGATDYIPKPIDSIEFIEKIKYYLDRHKTTGA